jgi:hypothetical protein
MNDAVCGCKIWSLPIGGRVLFALACRPFSPQILHTRSHTAPIWNIFNGTESLLEKSIIATKTKENG